VKNQIKYLGVILDIRARRDIDVKKVAKQRRIAMSTVDTCLMTALSMKITLLQQNYH
jgi:hypothetical protein